MGPIPLSSNCPPSYSSSNGCIRCWDVVAFTPNAWWRSASPHGWYTPTCFVHPDAFLNHCSQNLHFSDFGMMSNLRPCLQEIQEIEEGTSANINFSYSILFHLTTSYSSYFGGKKGISRNKTSFFYWCMSCSYRARAQWRGLVKAEGHGRNRMVGATRNQPS